MTLDVARDQGPDLRADARRNRAAILATAMKHFSQHGVGASLEEIAREAGVGAGTLYRHFPSREALLAASLNDGQAELLERSRAAQEIADADLALQSWLGALQDYLRSFNGLPAPVLEAMKQRASPLALTCDALVAMTREFLTRAQDGGRARKSVSADDLFLAALGMAWVLNRAESCGASPAALNDIFARGYFEEPVDAEG